MVSNRPPGLVATGTLVDRYVVVECLGQGATSGVYKARDVYEKGAKSPREKRTLAQMVAWLEKHPK